MGGAAAVQIRGGTLFLPRSALSPWCTHVDLEGCTLAGEAESADRGGGGWTDEDGVCEGDKGMRGFNSRAGPGTNWIW